MGASEDDALVVAQALAPPSRGVAPRDFHILQGPGRFGVLEPPKRFPHWTDHAEIVLPAAALSDGRRQGGSRQAYLRLFLFRGRAGPDHSRR
jgi:hypothetical protein